MKDEAPPERGHSLLYLVGYEVRAILHQVVTHFCVCGPHRYLDLDYAGIVEYVFDLLLVTIPRQPRQTALYFAS